VKLWDSNKDSNEEQGERIRVGQGKMKFKERTNCDSSDSSFWRLRLPEPAHQSSTPYEQSHPTYSFLIWNFWWVYYLWSEHSKGRHILKSNPSIKVYSDACIDMLRYTNQTFLEPKPHDIFCKVQIDICILPVISNIKSKARHHHTRKHVGIRSSRKKSALIF
jgi:hypothetical protein